MTRHNEAERQEAIERLRERLKPGDTIYTILRSVSRSGMSRHISTMIARDGQIDDVTWLVARAIGCRRNDRDGGIVITGCGMDMCFEVVYLLGQALWPEGFLCVGDGCQSNEHVNGDRNYAPHHHKDGGYALRYARL